LDIGKRNITIPPLLRFIGGKSQFPKIWILIIIYVPLSSRIK